ncbi:MAG: 2-aminoadipate transaminase [Candidatus Midichloriaceae bacterium]|jgi:2-aminoadipate transaminase
MSNNSPFYIDKFAASVKGCESNIFANILEEEKQIKISFAVGLPSSELFPMLSFKEAAIDVLSNDPGVLQYSPPSFELKQQIVLLMKERGVTCTEKQIFLTTGGQEGISLLLKLFLNKKDKIFVEKLIYPGFIQISNQFELDVVTINSTDKGIDVDEIERHLKNGIIPKFIYAIVDGHNPLSINTPYDQRLKLVNLAKEYQIPIIEDDPYGFLFYKKSIPPLKSIDPDYVFYVSSFSKILVPLLKVGWIIVPEGLIKNLTTIKEGVDLNTATISQKIIAKFLSQGRLNDHLGMLRVKYKEKRDLMVDALKKYFPKDAKFNVPDSGIFIWVELSDNVNTLKLLEISIKKYGISFMPGQVFSINKKLMFSNSLRLNFTNSENQEIIYGIEKLGELINEF